MNIKFKKKQKLIIMIFLLNINNNFLGTAADYLKNILFKYKGHIINGTAMAIGFGIGSHLLSEIVLTEERLERYEKKLHLASKDENGEIIKKTSWIRDEEGNLKLGRPGQKTETCKKIREFIKKFSIEEYIAKNFGLNEFKDYINSKINKDFIDAVLKKKERNESQ